MEIDPLPSNNFTINLVKQNSVLNNPAVENDASVTQLNNPITVNQGDNNYQSNINRHKLQNKGNPASNTIMINNPLSPEDDFLYSIRDKSPYAVFIQPLNLTSNSNTSLDPLEVEETVTKIIYKDIINIKKLTKTKF